MQRDALARSAAAPRHGEKPERSNATGEARVRAASGLREAALERPDFVLDLEDMIERTVAARESGALVLVSVDHLDIVNTAFGHAIGTAVLAAAREELIRVVRATDSVWRFAGSKFAVIMRRAARSDVCAACERFHAAMVERVYETDAGPISVAVSIGAVLIPQHATTAHEARNNALIAVEEARRDRWSGVRLFEPDLARDEARAQEAVTGQSVILAIAENRLRLAYQPVGCARTGAIAFHEALIRMVAADGTVTDAGDFVSAAERLGLVRLVDHKALQLALEAIETHRVDLSINISVDTCHDPAWLARLTLALEEKPELARHLIVEITESQAATELRALRVLVDALRSMDVRVAIDDFGAGYTSFRSLRQLPVDIIKIDGSFTCNLVKDRENQVFIQSLVAISRAIGAKTVVEWVDDADAIATLRDWKVDYLQGYAIGRPTLTLDT